MQQNQVQNKMQKHLLDLAFKVLSSSIS